MFKANAVSALGIASKKGSKSFRDIKYQVMMRSYVGKIRNSRDNFKGMRNSFLAWVSKSSCVLRSNYKSINFCECFCFPSDSKFLKKEPRTLLVSKLVTGNLFDNNKLPIPDSITNIFREGKLQEKGAVKKF